MGKIGKAPTHREELKNTSLSENNLITGSSTGRPLEIISYILQLQIINLFNGDKFAEIVD
jgi:hypothetical protein